MKKGKEYSNEDIAESFIFSNVVTEEVRGNMLNAFQKFRNEKGGSEPVKSKYKNALLQLKFIMEDYTKSAIFNKRCDFAFFLAEYISRSGMNYTDFANDIAVGVSTISQIIGKHRKPTDKIIFRLHIHSNKNFPASLWYHVLEMEKTHEVENNRSLLEAHTKHVKPSPAFL